MTPRKPKAKKPKKTHVVGSIGEEPTDLRAIVLTSEERPIVLKGLELLDKRLKKLADKKLPGAIREEVLYWRKLARVTLHKRIADAEVADDESLELLALDRTSRLMLRGAVDVYANNERAIVPMLKGLGKTELADELTAEASKWDGQTRSKLVEENIDMFDDEEEEGEGDGSKEEK